MATIDNYKVNIEVVGGAALKTAQADLQGLEGTIGGLSNKLNGLATAGLAAFAALGASALSMADDMADLAAATGISVGAIYTLSTALEQSGGSFDGGSMMIGKFAKALDEAVGGSQKAQEAFSKLGISTQELATMTDEQLFQAAIDGLAGMEDGFAKTALATQIFGKEAKNIDFDALAEGTRNAVDPEMEASLLQAAQFVDDVAAAFRNLQVAAVQAFGPILQVVGTFIADAENMKKVIQVIGALLAAAFAARIVGAIIATVNAMRLLGAAIKAAGVAQAFLTGLTGVGLIAVAASAAAAAAAYYALGKAMDSAGKSGAPVATPKGGDTPAPGTKLRDVQAPKGAKSAAQSSAESTAKAMREQAQSAQETTRQLTLQNEESNKLRELEISLIGLNSEKANLIKSNAQAQSTAAKDIAALEAKITEERGKSAKANQGVIIELQKQVEEKKKQLGVTLQLNQKEYDRTLELERQNNLLNKLRMNSELMGDYASEEVKQYRRKQVISGEISQEEFNNLQKLSDIRSEHSRKAGELNRSLGVAMKEQDTAKIEGIKDQIKTEKDRYNQAITNQKNQIAFDKNVSDSSKAGMRAAIENAKKITEPFYLAEQATASFFNNMNAAIDNFVDTGKFKFGDFARSVIADIAKMQLKAAATSIFSSIFKSVFKIPIPVKGNAAGGPVSSGKASLVGEQGPELFVPNSAGRILTNATMNKNAGASVAQVQPVVNNTYITNNISAIDSRSVAQMFVENRKSLLGASAMARKEMPYGG
jgi:lambda family phage tail tape measure protein